MNRFKPLILVNSSLERLLKQLQYLSGTRGRHAANQRQRYQ